MKRFCISIIIIFAFLNLNAQIIDKSDTLYGNEWIDFNKQYFKISVAKDGVYHLSYQQLSSIGIDVKNIKGDNYKLIAYGKEIPIYTSTNGILGENDYIEFYGEKNKIQLDSFLFRNKNNILNPEYSLFTDTASYFLTWDNSGQNKKYTELENDLSGNLPPVEEFYFHEEKLIINSDFNKPLRDSRNHVYRSNFDIGEGFASPLQQVNSFNINSSDVYNSGVKPSLSIRLTTNGGNHSIDVLVNNKVLKTSEEYGFICKNYEIPLSFDYLTPQMKIEVQGKNNSDIYDRNAVSVIKLKYSRKFNFLNKSYFRFKIEPDNFSKYIEINQFDLTGNNFVVYDLNNYSRLIPEIDRDNKILKFKLPPSSKTRDLIVVNLDKSTISNPQIEPVKFDDFSNYKDRNYIIVTDKNAFIDNNGINWVYEYEKYRSSPDGGSYKTLVVDVHDIYNQFGYGINRHDQGLNNFFMFLKNKFYNPDFVFIIGKGLEYNEIRTKEQLENPKNIFFVPTYGYPGSDNLLVAKYNTNYPDLPIGRIAAKNWKHIQLYLDKVKKHENYLDHSQTMEDKLWMKKVIHLVGGDPSIINGIRSSLKIMGNIISNNKFGAFVNSYERTSGTAQESVTKLIIDDIESGAGIVTFYGHSGISGTDFNISNLKNDRYPVFLSLGCYSGNIHTSILSGQSEIFVLNESGVIVYAGTSGTGFTGVLAQLGKNIYTLAGTEYYGHGLGEIIQKAIKLSGNNTGDAAVTLNQQFTYHGDPAVTLYTHPGPDYLIDYSTIKTIPSVINSNDEKFELNFDIVNLGYKIEDSITIKILRQLPAGVVDTIYQKIKSPAARKSVSIEMNTEHTSGIGENCISIFLDPNNKIEEQPLPDAENNNQLEDQNGENKYCFFIINNSAKPIYPSNFGIVGKQEIELQASTYNYFVEPNKYIFEIDTTELFDSPLLKRGEVISNGGLVSWNPNINMKHNTVYYWRIRPDSINQNTPVLWENSSFIYLQNSYEGWNQSHYYQYLKDDPGDIYIRENREFSFVNNTHSIEIEGRKYDPNNRKIVKFNGSGWATLNPSSHRPCISIFGLGPKGFEKFSGMNFGNVGNGGNYAFYFKTQTLEQRKGIKDLLDLMPDSVTVFVYTFLGDENQSLYPETWGEDSLSIGYNLFSVLEKYGANKIRLMEQKGTVPYVFVFKKGKGIIYEQIGKTIEDVFSVDIPVKVLKTSGTFSSKVIGPVKKWDKLLWKESNKSTDDVSSIKLFRLNNNLEQDTFVQELNSIYEHDLTYIDSKDYPYIKLEFNSQDGVDRSPTNLDFWRVLYQDLPDAVLVSNDEAYFYKDTLDFGDKFKFKTTVLNNSFSDLDSLTVRYKIKKQNNEEIIKDIKYPPLPANSSYFIEFEHPTSELQGINEFTAEVNPDRTQEEKYFFNNIGIKRFFVRNDNENPLLDVTFDNRHIMDGDIISPKPEINIMVKDNNKYLLLNDINIFKKITIVTPSGNIIDEPIENNNKLEFIPAESIDNNKAQLVYRPEFTEEGEYQMTVQASDVSGNMAGENEYKIAFMVILKEQISNVYNYPNPFSTKTKFIFTLTGEKIPENVTIRIMTLSGKVVRELTSIDLGELNIGQNITEKYWDGTDEYGRKLANGIYLYQVKAVNSEGKEYDLMDGGENDKKYFKQGFGKLVILR